jgi:hypothetical protein
VCDQQFHTDEKPLVTSMAKIHGARGIFLSPFSASFLATGQFLWTVTKVRGSKKMLLSLLLFLEGSVNFFSSSNFTVLIFGSLEKQR